MILSSKNNNGKRVYSFEMTEDEYKRAQKGETVKRLVQWSEGEGTWSVAFKRKDNKVS